jgi:hypothetical protein
MINHNGRTMRVDREEPWDGDDERRERILDKLSEEVSEACDRFFERRRMVRNFKEAWWSFHSLRSKDR